MTRYNIYMYIYVNGITLYAHMHRYTAPSQTTPNPTQPSVPNISLLSKASSCHAQRSFSLVYIACILYIKVAGCRHGIGVRGRDQSSL